MNKIKKWISKHKIIIFLFLFAFVIRIGVILWIDTPVISDFKTMLDASKELVNGTDAYKSMPYFICWGYQMGHVIYQAILLNIINSITFLKIVNAIVTSSTVIMIYLIGKELSTTKAAIIISIIYSIFLFPLLLNTVLTNQLLPMLLILIAIYLWMKKKKENKLMPVIIGILLGISNMLRSETIVIIIAFVLYTIFLMIKKENRKALIINLCLIIISYFTLTTATSFVLKATDISPSGLENKNSSWKFLEGLNIETRGQYSEDDAVKYSYDKKKTTKELKKRIQEEWQQYPLLFAKKTKILWLNSDLSWSLGHIENQEDLKLYEGINQIFIYFFVIMSLLSAITLFKKTYKKEQILILLILFVYFGVYLFIEVMPRYAYSLQIFEALLASITLGYILDNKKISKVGDHHAKTRK
ncbi:MAG TPA: glycosyltransferase family 39 protein [Candidatus Faecimonas intestinavium]|nr:glycosyltransferase family 39 protein [Candidatus Faecimonas intestinavium]